MDRETGSELWQDRFQATPNGDLFANDLVVSDRLVFAGGYVLDAAGEYEWTLRIYDSGSGTLVGGDRAGVGGINALGFNRDHVYAAGFIGSIFSGPTSFTVRVYGAEANEPNGRAPEEGRR